MNFLGAVVAGIAGIAAISIVMAIAPMMGMPAMNPADMLAAQMGGLTVVGWAGHLMIGTVLALVYWAVAASRLPGPPAARGAVFSCRIRGRGGR